MRIEDLIKIRVELSKAKFPPPPKPKEFEVVKEGFPIPSPDKGEDEQTYIARCNKELYDEYPDDAQRNAICYSKWEKQ
jgi:hypothetical protein